MKIARPALKSASVLVARALVAIVVLSLPGWSVKASPSPAPLSANPFARIDVVRLVASTPGVHKSVFEPDRSDPLEFESERYGIDGDVDLKDVRSGRLADAEWALVVPFADGRDALVYRWSGSGATVAGGLWSLLGAVVASFDVRDGKIAMRQPVYAMLGVCRALGSEVRQYSIVSGALHADSVFTEPRKLSPIVETPLRIARGGTNPFRGVPGAEFAARTPGLYRICPGPSWFQYYYASQGSLYGSPIADEAVSFRGRDGSRLIALPFASGGNGGVFSAAVYRLDRTQRLVLVRILASQGGHMSLRLVAGRLHALLQAEQWPSDDGWRLFFHDVTYEYDSRTDRLRAVSVAISPSFTEYRKLRTAPSPSPPPPQPLPTIASPWTQSL